MDLATKLQIKSGQRLKGIAVPRELATMLPTTKNEAESSGLLVFVVDRRSLETARSAVVASAQRDLLTWVAYPKAGQLSTDLKRDSLVALLQPSGIQPVRQVALDDVWSALRFRPA